MSHQKRSPSLVESDSAGGGPSRAGRVATAAVKTAAATTAAKAAGAVTGKAGVLASGALAERASGALAERVGETAELLRDRAADLHLRERAAELLDSAGGRASELIDSAGDRASGLKDTAASAAKAGTGLVAAKGGQKAGSGAKAAKSAADRAQSAVSDRLAEHADRVEEKAEAKAKAKRHRKRARRFKLLVNLAVIAGAGVAVARALRGAGQSADTGSSAEISGTEISGSSGISGSTDGGSVPSTPAPFAGDQDPRPVTPPIPDVPVPDEQPGPYVNESLDPGTLGTSWQPGAPAASDPPELAVPDLDAGAPAFTDVGSELTAEVPPPPSVTEPTAETFGSGAISTQPRNASFEDEDAPQRVDPPQQGD